MKIFICDDNIEAARSLRARIVDYCAVVDMRCVCIIYNSAKEMLAADFSDVQVLFLDVDMPYVNGIEVARELRLRYNELIIVYVTAWIEYAPYGYQVSAFRYLLKERLDAEFVPCMEAIIGKLNTDNKRILLQTKDGELELLLKNIVFFEGDSGRRVKVNLAGDGGAIINCSGKLSEFEQMLVPEGFVRIQRSYLVNMSHIKNIQNYWVTMADGKELKSSRQYYSRVKKSYALWRLSKE